MDKVSTVKATVAICMGLVLIALIVTALSSDIPISLRVFAIGASIYGFFEIGKWAKK